MPGQHRKMLERTGHGATPTFMARGMAVISSPTYISYVALKGEYGWSGNHAAPPVFHLAELRNDLVRVALELVVLVGDER
jgi:hypothetical protein